MNIEDNTIYEEQIFDELAFRQKKVRSTNFELCKFIGCDFSATDLKDSRFDFSNLDRRNFREAVNYAVNPLENSVEAASFSTPDVLGLLSPFKIKIDEHE